MKMSALAAVAAAALSVPLVAQAVPVTWDFGGTGNLCSYTGVGSSCSIASKSFTGSVTFNVLAPTPSGPDSGTNGISYAYDANGWVASDFLIQWDSTTYEPEDFAGSSLTNRYTDVYDNDAGGAYDRMVTQEVYAGVGHERYAYFVREVFNPSFLSGLAFDTSKGLAPGGTNIIGFADYQYAFNSSSGNYDYTGFSGNFSVTSYTQRADPVVSVPEPASVLFALGVLGLGLTHLRRRS